MLLNNNWSLNVDLNKWNPKTEGLDKTDFDALKQDVQSYRFYQKCLSGSTYVGVNSLIRGLRENAQIDDIYEIINHTDKSKSYYYDSLNLTFSQTFNSQTPSNGFKIDTLEDQDLFLTKSLPDYNFTLKNLFTPDRLIKDQKSNVFYVDLSTTERIENINSELIGLQIDGFFVREGQRVLVKDQYEEVTILNTIDPDTYFFGFYQIQEEVGSDITYRIPSSENGVYIYLRKRLVRTSELDAYENLVRYSIGVKMGLNNREKEYKLKRLNSGFYPDYQTGITYPSGSGSSIGESIYFEESHNFVLRQRVDYNNLFELSLNSTLAHATQSIIIDISTQTQSSTASYTIPQRILTIGEFGTIIVDQEGTTNIIPSKYKTTLRSISENTKYYWCVGDEGLLLRINKQDFEIKRISLDFPENAEQPSSRVLTRLNSIHFFNDLRGAIVGKFNQIWTTSDSGRTWKQIYLQDFDGFNFNSVVFTSIDTFFVGGDNGVFIEFNYNLGNWNILKRRISKLVDGIDDEFPLVDDIRDLHYFNSSGSNFIALGCELNKIYLYDIDGAYTGSPSDFIFLQDVNNINNDFGDVTALTWISSTSSLFFSTFDSIYQVDPFNGQFVGTNSNIFSVTFSQFIPQSGTNDIISFSDELIYTGNFSLWKKSDLTPTPTDVYDPTFFDRLKPRLLFMDYDIGSKLYWFDDFSQYRIPERYGITISYLQDSGSNTYIAFNENTNSVFDANTSTTITYSETNWITYFKDRQKTFEFYSAPALGDSTKVEPSFTFSSSDAVGKTFSYVTSSVSTGYTDIVGLMPIAVPRGSAPSLTQSSRFRDIAGVSITIPANPYNLYFYDYLGIWNESFVSGDITPDVGDVLHIDSDVFEGDFIINKKICTSSLVGGSPAQGQIRFMINFPGNPTWSGTFSINLFDSMGVTTSIFGPTFVNGASYSSTFQFLNDVVTPYINSNTQFQTFATLISGPLFASLNITSPIGTTWNGTTASVTFLPIPSGLGALISGKPVGYIPGILSGGIDPISGQSCFMYFYTDFNENILNNIPNSQTGFTVRDLNKYPLIPTSTSSDYFVDNFNKHYIGLSYDCEIVDNNATQSFLVTPKYSQWSAYYNLQTTVDVLDVNSNIYSDETKYASGFLNFGYSPTYNLLSYLNFIDPSEYVPGKEFLAMPHYFGIYTNTIDPTTSITMDTSSPTNRIIFGSGLKHIWDSYLKWTFINISFNTDENDFCFSVPGEIHDLQDRDSIFDNIGNLTGIPESTTFNGPNYNYPPSIYSSEGSGWEILVSTGSGEVLVNNDERLQLENQYGFSFSSFGWGVSGSVVNDDCNFSFISQVEEIPSDTEIWAVYDTSSMQISDAQQAQRELELWFRNYCINNISHVGSLYTLASGTEAWLNIPFFIKSGTLPITLINTNNPRRSWRNLNLSISANDARQYSPTNPLSIPMSILPFTGGWTVSTVYNYTQSYTEVSGQSASSILPYFTSPEWFDYASSSGVTASLTLNSRELNNMFSITASTASFVSPNKVIIISFIDESNNFRFIPGSYHSWEIISFITNDPRSPKEINGITYSLPGFFDYYPPVTGPGNYGLTYSEPSPSFTASFNNFLSVLPNSGVVPSIYGTYSYFKGVVYPIVQALVPSISVTLLLSQVAALEGTTMSASQIISDSEYSGLTFDNDVRLSSVGWAGSTVSNGLKGDFKFIKSNSNVQAYSLTPSNVSWNGLTFSEMELNMNIVGSQSRSSLLYHGAPIFSMYATSSGLFISGVSSFFLPGSTYSSGAPLGNDDYLSSNILLAQTVDRSVRSTTRRFNLDGTIDWNFNHGNTVYDMVVSTSSVYITGAVSSQPIPTATFQTFANTYESGNRYTTRKLDLSTGNLIWSYNANNILTETIQINPITGNIWIGSPTPAGGIRELNATTGAPIFTTPIGVQSLSFDTNGFLFRLSQNGAILIKATVSYSPTTITTIATVTTVFPGSGTFRKVSIDIDNNIYICGDGGNIRKYNNNLVPLWQSSPLSRPIEYSGNGNLYDIEFIGTQSVFVTGERSSVASDGTPIRYTTLKLNASTGDVIGCADYGDSTRSLSILNDVVYISGSENSLGLSRRRLDINIQPLLEYNPYTTGLSWSSNYGVGLKNYGWSGFWNKRSNSAFNGTSTAPSKVAISTQRANAANPWRSLSSSFEDELNSLFSPYVPPIDVYLIIKTPKISDRLLIVDKFYDSSTDRYVLELHDVIKPLQQRFEPYANYIPFYPNPLTSISILYRRFLHQISDDLQYINRIHRPKYPDNRTGHSDSYSFNAFALSASQVFGQYGNYETDINFKVPTDSYCKFLLSDANIIKDLTGILYTDYKYELAMQVNKLDREYELEVTSITQSGGLYEFQFSDNHLLNNNEWVVVSLIGTQSDFPDDLLGYHNIQVTGTGSFILPITPGPLSGTIGLKISHVKKDYFFNYQPIDIFDMGIDDKKITQSVEVLWENWDVFGQTYNLLNLNLDKYKFRLIDGLDIVQLNSKFQWILEAEISDAIIGMDKSGNLIWYKGIWHCGRWFGGRWISGSWLSGDWYFGDWTSKSIEDNKLSVKIGETNTTSVNSYWYGGRWFGGTWDNGTWYEGRWYGGTWSNGRWFEGIWNDGTWNNGEFKSGIWVLGQWNNGIFNETNGPSFWLDGKFYGGDFETGTWYNGIFDQKNNVLSRFGTKSTNSRNSLWRSGKFLNGQFHSFLNEDSNGVPQVSDVHKYSIWKTGLFSKGDFYGGLVYNINFKNTVWHGGISEDIEVLNVSTASNTFTLSGEWDWNINDEFYIVDNMLGGTFSIYGSTVNPIRYKVLKTDYDSINDETIVNTNVNLSNLLTGNPIENSWVVVQVEENYTNTPFPTLVPILTFPSFQDSISSGSFFSELVGSNWYIQNGQISVIQNNAPLYSIPSQLSGQSTYTSTQIDLGSIIASSPFTIYSITYNTNGTVTLSNIVLLTSFGITLNITLAPSYSLRCVSSFENSTWKSGLWRNGVFRGGNFLGGVWYNGFMSGNFG